MKPRHAFILALLLGIGAYILVQRTRTPNVSVNNTPIAQTVQTTHRSNQANTLSLTPSPSEGNIYLSDGLRVETTTINKQHTRNKFSARAEYPRLVSDKGKSDARVLDFNEAVRSFIYKEMSWSLIDARDREKEKREHWRDVEEYHHVRYEVSYASDDFISIVFTAEGYSWGAAHGYEYPLVINYDLRRNKILKPASFFKPRSDYLRLLSSYCKESLSQRHGAKFLDEQYIEPKAKYYENISVTDKGLLIMLGECNVLPCSAGSQSVLVPFEVLKDRLNPRSPVARLAGITDE